MSIITCLQCRHVDIIDYNLVYNDIVYNDIVYNDIVYNDIKYIVYNVDYVDIIDYTMSTL